MALVQQTVEKVSTMEGKSMTIDANNRFLFDALIKIYENQHTFLRELTANAYDAVVELWEKEYKNSISKDDFLNENPIVIGVYADDSGNYVEVKETLGIGMSPERMDQYLEAGLSTKRNSENQIGAKGIGRLSAFAYADEFYITTVSDGIKYFYMAEFYGNAPKLILLNHVETDEKNHSAIKVRIKGQLKNELGLIKNYIENNLFLFKNLVTNQIQFKSPFEDNYIETDNYYLFKSDAVGIHHSNYINIALGNIPYSLSYNKIDAVNNKNYNILPEHFELLHSFNCVIKFDPSDLSVTASRDNLELNNATQKAILEKLVVVIEELMKFNAEHYIESKRDYEPGHGEVFIYRGNGDKYYSKFFGRSISTKLLKIDFEGKESNDEFYDNICDILEDINAYYKINICHKDIYKKYRVKNAVHATLKKIDSGSSLNLTNLNIYLGDLKTFKKDVVLNNLYNGEIIIFKDSLLFNKYYESFLKYYCKVYTPTIDDIEEDEEEEEKGKPNELKFTIYKNSTPYEYHTETYGDELKRMNSNPDNYRVILYNSTNKSNIFQVAKQLSSISDKEIVLMTSSKFTKKYKMLKEFESDEINQSIQIKNPAFYKMIKILFLVASIEGNFIHLDKLKELRALPQKDRTLDVKSIENVYKHYSLTNGFSDKISKLIYLDKPELIEAINYVRSLRHGSHHTYNLLQQGQEMIVKLYDVLKILDIQLSISEIDDKTLDFLINISDISKKFKNIDEFFSINYNRKNLFIDSVTSSTNTERKYYELYKAMSAEELIEAFDTEIKIIVFTNSIITSQNNNN